MHPVRASLKAGPLSVRRQGPELLCPPDPSFLWNLDTVSVSPKTRQLFDDMNSKLVALACC